MDITALLIDYLNKKYGKEATNVLSENDLYYLVGDEYVEFDVADISSLKRRKVIMMLNQNTLLKISDFFHNNKIDYISFKGVILSNRLYQNSTSRNAGDIDVFVSAKNFERAYQLLLEKGYKLKYENGYTNQHHVILKNDTSILELHRSIINPQIEIDETYLLKHIGNIVISNHKITTFDLTATVLHLLYHLYMDSYLTYKNAYFVYVNRKLPKIKRFLYRAYEIALFSEKYGDQINWEDIQQDLTHQKLRFIFKKMILDIIEIFPHAFPESFLKTVFLLNYVEDEGDQLYKCLRESEIKEKNVDCILSNYINEHWMLRREKNIHQKIGDSFTLFKEIANEKTQPELRCTVNTERLPKGIKLSFDVLNNDLCFSDIDDYDTQKSDGVHLLLCGTEEYSYNSIFFFPKVIHGEIKVVSCDVRNDANDILDEKVVQAEFMKTERGYTITAVFSSHFIEMNHLDSYFYMGFVVSDFSKETQCRKNQLILSEKEEQWYNPIYFAKIEMK